jgi:hypothetical protein
MQLHLDIEVDNLDEAVGAAVALGVTRRHTSRSMMAGCC